MVKFSSPFYFEIRWSTATISCKQQLGHRAWRSQNRFQDSLENCSCCLNIHTEKYTKKLKIKKSREINEEYWQLHLSSASTIVLWLKNWVIYVDVYYTGSADMSDSIFWTSYAAFYMFSLAFFFFFQNSEPYNCWS